jgi:hypothetical protein
VVDDLTAVCASTTAVISLTRLFKSGERILRKTGLNDRVEVFRKGVPLARSRWCFPSECQSMWVQFELVYM